VEHIEYDEARATDLEALAVQIAESEIPHVLCESSFLKRLTAAAAPQLVGAFGIGLDIAAKMLITVGDNNDRVRSEAAFGKLCGACPIPAGSGKTNGRHRLNRRGKRQANAALYRAVIVRMRRHAPTRPTSRDEQHRGCRRRTSSAV
jgi:transposase